METMTVTDAYGRDIEVEVGVDGENPVSPNNPSQKTAYVARRDFETSDEDGVGSDGENPVSPNNPPEKTQTVSEGGLNGLVPEGVDPAVVEAAQNNWYPASYQPVKSDTDEHGQPVPAYGPTSTAAVPSSVDESPAETSENDETSAEDESPAEEPEAPANDATKAEWISYVTGEPHNLSEEDAKKYTRDQLAEKYGTHN